MRATKTVAQSIKARENMLPLSDQNVPFTSLHPIEELSIRLNVAFTKAGQ
jgi:hypothetical protein